MRTENQINEAMATLQAAFGNKATVPVPATAPATVTDKKASQYWAHLGYILDLDMLSQHNIKGLTYLFESGFPVDSIKEKVENFSSNEEAVIYNTGVQVKNTLRADIIAAMEDLECGDFKALALTDDPQAGDPILVVRRLDPNNKKAETTLAKTLASRTKVRKTF